MKGVALVLTLAVLVSIATASPDEPESNPATLDVQCNTPGPEEITVKVPKTTLTVTCPENYTIQPPAVVTQGSGKQQVYSNASCDPPVDLSTVCSGASATASKISERGLVFQFPEAPCEQEEFYLLCKPTELKNGDETQCKVRVLIKNATPPDIDAGGPGPGPGAGPGTQDGPTGQDVAGGTAGVQTCAHASRSITISVPEKGSSVQFACGSNYNLYPIEPSKVFSKDCKKQETLQDMTRTRAPAATPAPGSRTGPSTTSPTTVPTYTLKAEKKPAKKTLCYLCAEEGTTPHEPGTVENYCTIYVESGACTQSGFTLALMLPCVLAVLRFM